MTLVMVLSLTGAAFAGEPAVTSASDPASQGSITITNATIGAAYHVYKLFDVTYGAAYEAEDDEGNPVTVIPTSYIATEAQKTALEQAWGNVFAFAELPDTLSDDSHLYQVTVGTHTEAASGQAVAYTDAEVTAFIESFIATLSGGVTACYFPGASEEIGSENEGFEEGGTIAAASTVAFHRLPEGYYFVTSSQGSVVTLTTTNPSASIIDKNPGSPDWPENPDLDGPVKDVRNSSGQSIDGEKVLVGDTLTYVISYLNDEDITLDQVVITDKIPTGTSYVTDSVKVSFYTVGEGDSLTPYPDEDADSASASSSGDEGEEEQSGLTYDIVYNNASDPDSDSDSGEITWTIRNLPAGVMLAAEFQVTVKTGALNIENRTIVNEADVAVTIGANTYDLTTNQVQNPVGEEGDPVKTVEKADSNQTDDSGVKVGDILTYSITYTNEKEESVKRLTIKDTPPTGTVYVADSATISITGEDGSWDYPDTPEGTTAVVTIDSQGVITWEITELAAGYTVTVSFQVEVTEAALTIVEDAIRNTAHFSYDGTNFYETNETVTEIPGDEEPGKVIVNADGTRSTVSTGAFGNIVTFEIEIDAENQVEQEIQTGEEAEEETETRMVQVVSYYIYDKLDAGFTVIRPEDEAGEDSETGEDAKTSMYVTINGVDYSVQKDETQVYADEGVTTYTIYGAGTDEDAEVGTLFIYEAQASEPESAYTLIAVTIPWVDAQGNALYPDCRICLTYQAVINENAEIAGDGNGNSAFFDYATTADEKPHKPDPSDPTYPGGKDQNHGSEERSTTTYTYALGIQKISADTGAPLAGATFRVTDAGGNPVYAVPETEKETGKILSYHYVSAEDGANAAGVTDSFVSNSDGQIILKGVNIGTYTVEEIKAPAGYNLLKEPIQAAARMDSSETTYNTKEWTVTRYFEAITEEEFVSYEGDMYQKQADNTESATEATFTLVAENDRPDEWDKDWETDPVYYKLTGSQVESSAESGTTTITFPVNVSLLEVENVSGSQLPSTGGIGTTVFYILGAVLAIGAGVLLVVRRRMRAEQ